MKSGIRPADAVTLYGIFNDPGDGGDQLQLLLNILGKCLGVASDRSARGGHSGGNYQIGTATSPQRVQLFSYSTKSYTREKVTEALVALTPLVADLTDENLRRVVNFANAAAAVVTPASFIDKS